MARHKITNKASVKALNLSPTAISNLKKSDYLPELNSNKICNLSHALSQLAGVKITPFDLMEYIEN